MHRSRPLIAVLLAAAALAATPALAQNPPRPAGTPDRDAQRRAAFDRLDANKDGYVDRNESHAARAAVFDRLDADKDGRLTVDELMSTRRGRGQGAKSQAGVNAQTDTATPVTDVRRARAERQLKRLDTDKDGTISRAEWLAVDDRRFDRCDADKDGKLAFGECRVAQATRGDRRSTTVR
ncbi:EF-hand domain-containing protein [Vineibacter terrae]|uniref:EF-hand domain-containing protein n=1 Tax=Vineibacter terrae TaxID=2586908 RepID=UPI002E372BDF|nr:EF-hand domain-containing protein [Vineibacter terrae]HEX2885263.1 EF-hand domain-containing protein [Vineibacter terrae]